MVSIYKRSLHHTLCLLCITISLLRTSNAFTPTLCNHKLLISPTIKPQHTINKNRLYLSDRTIEIEKVSNEEPPTQELISLSTLQQSRSREEEEEYKKGLITIGFITLLFSSMSPAMHAALADTNNAPPVLLLNAVVSVVALLGLVLLGPLLEEYTSLPRSLAENTPKESILPIETQAGLELGIWKFLGTTFNLYGLSYTTADHGAFLIQLTTLIVPTIQGIMGVPIPTRIKTSIGLALMGVYLFTQDPQGSTCTASSISNADTILMGDVLCVIAAIFYATYDLRLFKYGKLVKPRELITGKIIIQALLSILLVLAVGYNDTVSYLSNISSFESVSTVLLLAVWSGLTVNAIAPFLQVSGQQAIGPTRAQTLYASQPLWASILSFVFLGEVVGYQGLFGGFAFLSALFLAATSDPPDVDCGVDNCEV